MMTLHVRKTLIICLISCASTLCRAESFNLEVYASRFDSIPIAVLPFTALSGQMQQDNPGEVVAGDLEFSPRFMVVRAPRVDKALFDSNGVCIYIHGEYRMSAGQAAIDCYLRDAQTTDLLIGKTYQGELKSVRSMAHRFSNHVVEMLLGERGIFESRIVYVKEMGEIKNISIMDYDGYNRRQLTNTNTVNVFPAFIDAQSIVWTSFMRGKPDLYKGSITSGKSGIYIYSRFVETSPAVSLVEGKIAFASSRSGNMEIYTCDLDKTNTRRLTHNRAIDTSPCWSPNGYQIAFTSDRSGQPQIYIMDADGANVRRLTFEGRYQDSPAWSPRGDKIAYASFLDGKFDICTIGPDGSNPMKITNVPGNNTDPNWSPDGNHIVFACRRGGKSDLFVVRYDGTGLRQLTSVGNACMPDWSPF